MSKPEGLAQHEAEATNFHIRRETEPSRLGVAVVVGGLSGSGKDYFARKYLEKHPDWQKVVTTTTRAKRDGDVDGVNYHFVTPLEFKLMIANHELAEEVEYPGDDAKKAMYGTTVDALRPLLSGTNLMWIIDMQGVFNLEETKQRLIQAHPEFATVQFVTAIVSPSNIDILQRRFTAREQQSGRTPREITAAFRKRVSKDRPLWKQLSQVVLNQPHSLCVTNDDIDTLSKGLIDLDILVSEVAEASK